MQDNVIIIITNVNYQPIAIIVISIFENLAKSTMKYEYR